MARADPAHYCSLCLHNASTLRYCPKDQLASRKQLTIFDRANVNTHMTHIQFVIDHLTSHASVESSIMFTGWNEHIDILVKLRSNTTQWRCLRVPLVCDSFSMAIRKASCVPEYPPNIPIALICWIVPN